MRLLLILLIAVPTFAAEVGLEWDASPDAVSGYKVYWGPSEERIRDNSVTLTNVLSVAVAVAPGTNYFGATAWVLGSESAMSNIIWTNVSPGVPVRLRFATNAPTALRLEIDRRKSFVVERADAPTGPWMTSIEGREGFHRLNLELFPEEPRRFFRVVQ